MEADSREELLDELRGATIQLFAAIWTNHKPDDIDTRWGLWSHSEDIYDPYLQLARIRALALLVGDIAADEPLPESLKRLVNDKGVECDA